MTGGKTYSRLTWNSMIASHAVLCSAVADGSSVSATVTSSFVRSKRRSERYCSDLEDGTRPVIMMLGCGRRALRYPSGWAARPAA